MEKSDEGNTSIISFMTIIFMVFAVCSVSAATAIFVENGDNLQAIINNAGNSDNIIVENGFSGNVDVNKPLRLREINTNSEDSLIDDMGDEFGINISVDEVTLDGLKVNDVDSQKTNEETQKLPGFGLIAGLAALVIAIIMRKQH